MENIYKILINSQNTNGDVNSDSVRKCSPAYSTHITKNHETQITNHAKKEKNQVNANVFTLIDMEPDWDGVIVEIHGGHIMISRLSTLGLMVGAKIKKVSQHIMSGPVVVEIGRTQIAIGIGIAKKVLVFVNKEGIK